MSSPEAHNNVIGLDGKAVVWLQWAGVGPTFFLGGVGVGGGEVGGGGLCGSCTPPVEVLLLADHKTLALRFIGHRPLPVQ